MSAEEQTAGHAIADGGAKSKDEREPVSTLGTRSVLIRPSSFVLRPTAELAALALLPLLISCVMLWPALTGSGVLAPTDIVTNDPLITTRPFGVAPAPAQNPLLSDAVDTFIPWKLYERSELQAGRIPLWNPYSLLGTHFLANLQSQIFSPFNLLWLLLPALWGLGAVTALKWTLCGLGTGLLLRRLGLRLVPALFGSVAFQLSGPVVAWLQWPISEGLMWLPWLLWAIVSWLDTRAWKWLAAFSLLVCFEILAGHAETTFHTLAFTGLFGVLARAGGSSKSRVQEPALSAAKGSKDNAPRIVSTLLALGGAGVLGVGMSAVQWLPFLDILPSSAQWVDRAGLGVGGMAMPPNGLLLWLSANSLGLPGAYAGPLNWIEANPYVGIVTLLLAIWAIASLFTRTAKRTDAPSMSRRAPAALSPREPLLWLCLLFVLASMVYGLPPFSLLRDLPGFNTSFNWRLVSAAGLCLAVLGAMGLDRLLSTGIRLGRLWLPGALALGLAGLLLLFRGAQIWLPNSDMSAWRAWAVALLCFAIALILARLGGLLGSRTLALLLLALLTVDMAKTAWNFNPASPYSTFYSKNPITAFLTEHGPTERVAIEGRFAEANMLMAFPIADLRAYDPTLNSRYMTFMRLVTPQTFRLAFQQQDVSYTAHLFLVQPNAVYLSAIGVKWLVCLTGENPNGWQPVPARAPIYRQILDYNGFTLWQDMYARPYVYFASTYQVASSEDILMRRMRALTIERVNDAQIEDPNGTLPADLAKTTITPLTAGESTTIESYAPGNISIRAVTNSPRFVVLSEGWAPGWRATVDRAPAAIYRTDYVLQGVAVPAGTHDISFTYDPPAFRQGAGISVASWLVWLVLLGLVIARRKLITPFTAQDIPATSHDSVLITPYSARAFARSWARLLHLVPSLLTVLAAGAFILLAAHGFPPVPTLLWLLAIEAAMQFSISAFNDYFDRYIDAGRPDKPVARGDISPRTAVSAGAVFALVAVGLSLPFGPWLALLTAVGLAGGLLYDAGLKYTVFSWLPFCIAFPTLPLWAWAGVHTGGAFPPQLFWVVPVGAVLVLSIHLSDTLPDVAGDSRAGVRGLAHRLGTRRAVGLCWGAFCAALLLTLVLWSFLRYNPVWYAAGLLLSVTLILSSIAAYRANPARLRSMALLIQMACLALAVGWIGAILLS